MDYNDLVLTSLSDQTVMNGFFLVGGHIILRPGSKQAAQGLYIAGNEFVSVPQDVEVDESTAAITGVQDVYITGSLGANAMRGVTMTLSATSATPTTTFTVDFSQALAFNVSRAPIQRVAASFVAASLPAPGAVPALASYIAGSSVTVVTSQPVVGTVFITAGQSAYTSQN